jgi:hypothetical protein
VHQDRGAAAAAVVAAAGTTAKGCLAWAVAVAAVDGLGLVPAL